MRLATSAPKVNCNILQFTTQKTRVLSMDRFFGGAALTKIYCGDCTRIMADLDPDSIGAVITDPPYASGGTKASDRWKGTSGKYTKAKHAEYAKHDFDGDSMDQRCWMDWTIDWMRAAKRVAKDGAPFVVFIDWRQLPAMTDCFQRAGLVWRGVAAWDKLNGIPQRGRFRQQTEYIVWGSKGNMPLARNVPILPGAFRCAPPAASVRVHQTEKPLDLMRQLVHICEPGETILDPFAGSGTTLLAAEQEGYDAVGVEMNEYYADRARERLNITV